MSANAIASLLKHTSILRHGILDENMFRQMLTCLHEYPSRLELGQIRLIHIHPDRPRAPLKLSLHTHSLDQAPAFEAVSYVWGRSSRRIPVICDGGFLHLTWNLHDALVRFRQPGRVRVVWADAVCINQRDPDERSEQVCIMHLIYSSCTACLVWLGREEDYCTTAVRLVHDIAAAVCAEFGIDADELDEHLQHHGRDLFVSAKIGFQDLPPADSQDWGSLFRFLHLPWFSRVWVIQEAHFAPRVLFFCGVHAITYGSLYYAADWTLANATGVDWTVHPDMSRYYSSARLNIMMMRQDSHAQRNLSLNRLLNRSKDFDATDPRDKVYAMMHFPAFEREYSDLRPDYRRPVVDIYADVAIACMHYNNDLAVLTEVDSAVEGEEGFPSWLQRWNRPDKTLNTVSVWYSFFSAAVSQDTPADIFELLPNHVLQLVGFEFDTIQDVCDISCVGHDASPVWKPIFTPAEPWTPFPASGGTPYSSEAAIVTAYAMALTAGCREHSGIFALECTPERADLHKSDFVAWLQWLRDAGVFCGDRSETAIHYPPGLYSQERPFLENTPDGHDSALHFHNMVRSYTLGRRLFRSKRGYLGLGSSSLQHGDQICILYGGKIPFILRRREEGDGYSLVGDAYVHGIMKGEGIRRLRQSGLEAQNIHLY